MPSKPMRGDRAKKNAAKKTMPKKKSTAMPGGNGKTKTPVKKKEKTDPSKPKKKNMAMTGGNGKTKPKKKSYA